jgi:hypothetical protein
LSPQEFLPLQIMIANIMIYYIFRFEDSLLNSLEENGVFISHTVTNYEFLYEPFYLSLNSGKKGI